MINTVVVIFATKIMIFFVMVAYTMLKNSFSFEKAWSSQ